MPKLARQFEIDARAFSANSHVLSLLYTHFAHTDSLNETCDALRVHEPEFMRTRGATPPARNTFAVVEREMSFITNNTNWSARTIAELYRARWTIELFFKEIKQTPQLRDFIKSTSSANPTPLLQGGTMRHDRENESEGCQWTQISHSGRCLRISTTVRTPAIK